MLYSVLSPVNRLLLRVFFRLKVVSPESIPPAGGLVVVANHDSVLDAFVVAAALPGRRLTFLAASYLFDMSVVGWFVRSVGALPVAKDENNFGSLRKALAVLKSGGTVAVFPEGGTLSSDIFGGAAYLAMKADVPILPLHVCGTAEALPPGRYLPSFRRISVNVGDAFSLADLAAQRIGRKQAVAEGKQRVERVLRQVCET